ncbi:MAG: M48 family metallopeptidase [Alphaproteobacteria bacterium]|nr:M48 family metallopeptidase [Alphaproteobacteria bacterium]
MTSENLVHGRLFMAGSSRFQEVTVRCIDSQLFVRNDVLRVMHSADLRTITLDSPVAGVSRKLTFPDGAVLEIQDHMAVEEMLALGLEKPVRRPRSYGLSLGKWAILVLAAILMPVVFWFLYPITADAIARALPESLERKIADTSLDQMDKVTFSPSRLSFSKKRDIWHLFREVSAAAEAPFGSVKLEFRRSEIFGANAIALPDGTIVMLDGLVQLANNNDELAGVLAHEIGHIQHRHALRRTVRAAGITALASLILGDSVSAVEELVSVGLGLSSFAFSREFELEADETAAKVMRKMGRDPTAMIALLRRIQSNCDESCEETSLFATHPGLRERLEALQSAQ